MEEVTKAEYVSRGKNDVSKYTRSIWYHNVTTLLKQRSEAKNFTSHKGTSCTLLKLHNMAEPTWISVNCSNPYTTGPVCQQTTITFNNVGSIAGLVGCDSHQFKSGKFCIMLVWQQHPAKEETRIQLKDIHKLSFIFYATDQHFPALLLPHKIPVVVHSVHHHKFFDKLILGKSLVSDKTTSQVHAFESKLSVMQPDKMHNMFQCGDGSFVSVDYLCDGVQDCPEVVLYDEQNCSKSNPGKIIYKNQTLSFYSCKHIDEKCVMPQGEEDLARFATFNDTASVDRRQQQVNNTRSCQQRGLLKCKTVPVCFEIKNICIFRLSEQLETLPCKFGDHLQNCTYWDCNTYFKCPGYYCVPWSYVCDRKWDCPFGHDEDQGCDGNQNCSTMFRCKHSQACIHLRDVCNRRSDCNLGEDEFHCKLFQISCPQQCQCLAYSLKCSSILALPDQIFPHISLALSWINLTSVLQIAHSFPFSHFLDLKGNCITNICDAYRFTKHLVLIDNSFNSIFLLEKYCVKSLVSLQMINLDFNNITQIMSKAFFNLSSLTVVSLSHNMIQYIASQFLNVSQILLLGNNGTTKVEEKALHIQTLTFFKTDNYVFCCMVLSHTQCTAEVPWEKSCSSILIAQSIKISFYVVSLCIFVPNAFSIVAQVIANKHKTPNGKIL